jgi:hypothetical protein
MNFEQLATASANAIISISGLAAPPPPPDDCAPTWGPREPCVMLSGVDGSD